MNITQKDTRALWRSPFIWFVLAVISFIAAWLFWQMIDRYNSVQASLVNLPNPPTISDALWVPYVLTFAKLLMLVVALTSGVSLAQERSQRTLWYLLINQTRYIHLVVAKFKAQLLILGYVVLQSAVVVWLLASGGSVNWLQMVLGTVGLCLFVIWLIALGQLISSYCQSTGTAVLLNVVVFVLLWILGGDGFSHGYGLNWLILMSPVHHLRWFCAGEFGVSSLIYFIAGAAVFLWLSEHKLQQLRQSL